MTEQQSIWFENLVKDRQDSAKTLEKHSMRGVKTSVVEKYSDQAHFIYELLQNADDAKATKSEFVLKENGLFFKHNGNVHFTVTDPDNERADSDNNKLGHINSITSVGSSSKNDHSTIGKFGVGFKAVFQYTETPHIYDHDFQFKIERFIVPAELKKDIEDRQVDETIFYFPFDKKEMPKERAYSDILGKLKSLSYPVLFLSNLQSVSWKAAEETGKYIKLIAKENKHNDIKLQQLNLTQKVGLKSKKEKLLLFTRQIEGRTHPYSIGFFLDKGKLKPKSLPAFCFFPTKETTNLNFIIHAPFLLTDSREGIKKDNNWNKKAVKKLAELAADSLMVLRDMQLIDDGIINIIPYNESDFLEEDSEEGRPFYPFFKKIKKKFQTEELLPAKHGEYVNRENSFWADSTDLTNLFSNKQLSILTGNPHAKWVFTSLQRRKDSEITNYIDGGSEYLWNRKEPNLIKANLDLESKIVKMIDAGFIEKQTFEWLHQFYQHLSERKSYIEKFKTKPIFKDTRRNSVAAFWYESKTKDFHPILFLPSNGINSTFATIHKTLLENKISKEFIIAFGIKEPDLKDEIFNHILPLYDNDGDIDTDTHFKMFFRYYKENHGHKTVVDRFISLIKDKKFVSYKNKIDQKTYRGRPEEIYYQNNDLIKYFETKPNTLFVDLDDYYKQIDKEDHELLNEFLVKLGVCTIPKVLTIEITDWREKYKFHLSRSTGQNDIYDKIIDGSAEILESNDISRFQILWKQMIKIVNNYQNFEMIIKGRHDYVYYSNRTEYFESSAEKFLHASKWLATKNGNFVAPHKITINDLAEGYEVKSIEAQSLIEFLQFKPTVVLTKEQRISQMFESEEEARRAKELLDNENAKLKMKQNSADAEYDSEELEDAVEELDLLSKSILKTKSHKEKTKRTILSLDFDEDEELAKGVDEIKNKLEIKKNRIAISKTINESTKYSYQWFEAYLKLLLTYSETQSTIKQQSVSFQEIKRFKVDDKISEKYFLLRGASAYIPQSIEDSEDFKVTLIRKNHKDENVTVEGVSKKGQDLLIYCREAIPQSLVTRLSNIIRVDIKFTPVIDLLERLFKAFTNKNNITEWEDILATLPALNYIYGPPGTGKTTTLCNRIDDILKENIIAKFLILTPTNKASDVLCKKLYGINSDIIMARLGTVSRDPELEKMDEEIYRDSLTNNDLRYISVVASTIHRLPYFDINDEKFSCKLFQYRNFDYIIFDESSMTGLPYIVFAILALLKTNPNANFIVAGDPKQIPPVIEVNDKELESFDFQDENIYKMMGLDSFDSTEQKIREIDEIDNLDKQYRSVRRIGQLFSELSYSKLLKHDREVNRKESKTLPEEFKKLISSTVTFIDIPLNQENSIYKINKLLFSSYQTYCAILVSEIVKYFDLVNKNQQWTIGLIAPYKAQAILLNKLITSFGISENIKVYADTVHGFQGDECDIVFFIINPNNYYYTNHPKCLLSKEYIYNVAISRAKDYLIILHPFFTIQNNEFISKITQSYRGNFGTLLIKESFEIEKIIFGKEKFIENNSYVTGHDNVNVFGLTEMKYFIKSSESAIDIQLRLNR